MCQLAFFSLPRQIPFLKCVLVGGEALDRASTNGGSRMRRKFKEDDDDFDDLWVDLGGEG
jgi:hypothetical protein